MTTPYEKRIEQVIQQFKHHELRLNDPDHGRWQIMQKYRDDHPHYAGKWDNNLFTEIISLEGGRLFVGGDICDCTFAYHGCARDLPRKDKDRSMLHWVAGMRGSYLLEKAQIGLTDNGALTEEWDADLAREHLQSLIDGDDRDDSYFSEDDLEALEHAKRLCYDGEHRTLWYLSDEVAYFQDGEMLDFGKRTTIRVLHAWAAVNRLVELLEDLDD